MVVLVKQIFRIDSVMGCNKVSSCISINVLLQVGDVNYVYEVYFKFKKRNWKCFY